MQLHKAAILFKSQINWDLLYLNLSDVGFVEDYACQNVSPEIESDIGLADAGEDLANNGSM